MNEEIVALHEYNTCDIVLSSDDKNVIGLKWVYKIKQKSYGSVECYKAKLVVKGFTQ